MTRKIFFFTTILILLTVFAGGNLRAQFSLPKLPYSYSALEPYIDSTTMYIHYNNHHKAYVNNLNTAVDKHPALKGKSVEQLISNLAALPVDVRVAIRNSGGGHYNHTLFWSLLASPESTKLSGDLEKAIVADFGSTDNFKSEFEKAALGCFGSGWAWLIIDSNGKLKICSTPNQDNPIMSLAEIKGVPILTIDVWEHAYYLKYQSSRASYVKAFWNVVNWDKVNELYRNGKK